MNNIWNKNELAFLEKIPDCISGLDVFIKFINAFPNSGKTLKSVNEKLEKVKYGMAKN